MNRIWGALVQDLVGDENIKQRIYMKKFYLRVQHCLRAC